MMELSFSVDWPHQSIAKTFQSVWILWVRQKYLQNLLRIVISLIIIYFCFAPSLIFISLYCKSTNFGRWEIETSRLERLRCTLFPTWRAVSRQIWNRSVFLLSHASIAQSCIICLYDKRWPAIYFGRLVPSGEISEIKSPANISWF